MISLEIEIRRIANETESGTMRHDDTHVAVFGSRVPHSDTARRSRPGETEFASDEWLSSELRFYSDEPVGICKTRNRGSPKGLLMVSTVSRAMEANMS